LILIFGFLGSGMYSNVKYAYQYYAISMLVYGMLNGAMTASNCFMERDIKKPNLRIIYSPAGNFSIYFSNILASFVFDYGLHLLLIPLICIPLHVTLGNNPVFFILLMAPVEFMSVCLGIFFCCIFKCEETTSMLLSLLISLMAFLGGTFFSFDSMGKLAFISSFSPVKWLTDAFFSLACDNNLTYFLPVFLSTTIASVLLVIGCRKFFRTEDYI
jgi:ABC-2 type transport system permease protein